MSSCLSGGGRTYRLDLDIVKPPSPPSPAPTSHSSPSSTLSESSNTSSAAISIKKPRAPRKRPNQTYNEAAALLAAIYPTVFSPKSLGRMSKQPKPLSSFPESNSDLLPPLPALGHAAFLIHQPSAEHFNSKPEISLKSSSSSPTSPVSNEFLDTNSPSPVSNESRQPKSPSFVDDNDDFDAESILDEEIGEGIDSIMGKLTMENSFANTGGDPTLPSSSIHPYITSLAGFGLGSQFELGLGFRRGRSIHQALKHRGNGDWCVLPAVPVKDIFPEFKPPAPPSLPLPPPGKKKSKKKVEKGRVKEVVVDAPSPTAVTNPTSTSQRSSKPRLGLKLNHEDVLKAWSDRGPMFSDHPDSPNSSLDAIAKLAEIDLFPESGSCGGVREASVLRYKEKRRSRLFSKKIRYQVRKVNADCRPRMKGKFIRSLLHQAMEEESQ